MTEWNVIQEACAIFAKCGNIAEVLRVLQGNGINLNYGKLYRMYKKYKSDFEEAATQYKAKVFEKTEAKIDLEIQILHGLERILKKIEAVIDEIDIDTEEKKDTNKIINALAAATNALTGLSREISRLSDVQSKRVEWRMIKENEIIQWCMSQQEIKPLIVAKRKELEKYLADRKKK